MAFPFEDTTADAKTIYAKPFPKSTTDDSVRDLFGIYGSIRRVKLRREISTNSFRGSVYIEFADAASAHAAVSNPPQQPQTGSSAPGPPQRFHVMMKADYERKRANASSSGGKDGGSSHKRARHRSEGFSQQQQQQPSPPLPGEQQGMTPRSATESYHYQHQQQQQQHQQEQQQQHQHQQQQQQIQHWRELVEERDVAMRKLEESLRKERGDNQRLHQRLEEAQQRAQEATAREAAANQKALGRDVEIGSLKGEIAMLRTQGSAQLERQSAAHKARISELEASLQRLKDSLLEKERGEREMRKAAANSNKGGDNGGGARRPGGPGSSNDDGGALGNGFLDDL